MGKKTKKEFLDGYYDDYVDKERVEDGEGLQGKKKNQDAKDERGRHDLNFLNQTP